MNEEQKGTLNNALEDIQKALRQAKRALRDGHFTDLYGNLKAAHNATSKAKNLTVDFALGIADNASEEGEG